MSTKFEPRSGVLRTIKSFVDHSRLGEILVLLGILSRQELRLALAMQKSSGVPLGRILVENGFVGRPTLFSALALQRGIRLCTATLTVMIAFSAASTRSARADDIVNISQSFQLASARADIARPSFYPSLFNTVERGSRDISAFTKWSSVLTRFEAELSDQRNATLINKWKDDLRGLQGLPLEEMASRVNDMMNSKRYISDSENYGQSDFWATPVQFLRKGGDCEDYAIAKYVSLRALGVPEERMRIAIVHDKRQNTPHAVLVVYTDSSALVLDNQNKSVRDSAAIRHYKPIFSINQTGWWLHKARDTSGTMVASAAQ